MEVRAGRKREKGYRRERQKREREEGREEQDERRKMRGMRRLWEEKKSGRGAKWNRAKNKAVEAAGGGLNILRWIELKLSKNSTNWRGG